MREKSRFWVYGVRLKATALVAFTLGFAPLAHGGQPPANDDFANRSILSGQAVLVSTYNTNATAEVGEPSLGNYSSAHSLWWSWTSPYTGTANFSTYGSDGTLTTAVFVGGALASLSEVGLAPGLSWYDHQPLSSFSQLRRGDSVNVSVQNGQTYQIRVSASESAPSLGRVILGINQPPVIISEAVVKGSVGHPVSYQISATNSPMEYGANDLPPGLAYNSFTGIISGTPVSAGTSDVLVTATNAGGTGKAKVRFQIADFVAPSPVPPEFTSGAATVSGAVGRGLDTWFYFGADVTQVSSDTLPPGLSLTFNSGPPSDAYISGDPTQAGLFQVPIHITNAQGTVDASLTFRIGQTPPLPVMDCSAVAYGQVGTSFSYFFSGINMSDGTYTVGPLPDGLRAVGSTISGIPTGTGTFEVPVSATNAAGTATGTLTIVITPVVAPPPTMTPPVFVNMNAALGSAGQAFSYYATSNALAQYSATGLPAGLTIDPATGLISGSATTSGTYDVIIQATNSFGTTTTPITLVFQTPNTFVYSGPAMENAVVGTFYDHTLSAGNIANVFPGTDSYPTQSLDSADLPPGLTYTSQPPYGGYISGTPTVPGVYRIPFSSTNADRTIHATFTLVVIDKPYQAPVVTSAASAQGAVGTNLDYYASASNLPENFSANDLPPGLSIDASTGYIHGTPTQAGMFTVDLMATNSIGTGHARVTIAIDPLPAGTFSNAATYEGTVGISLSESIHYFSTTSVSENFSATGLPEGLQISPSGFISGTPTTAGAFPITISATDASGTRSTVQTFLIHPAPPPPVIKSAASAHGSVGAALSYSLSASGSSPTLAVENLPPGLAVNAYGITGTPTTAGDYQIPISAQNAGGTTTALLHLRVDPPAPPTLSLQASDIAYLGRSYSLYFSGSNVSTYRISGTLPPGISYDPSNQALTGTPSQTGSFPLQITATGPGGSVTVPFTLVTSFPDLSVITSPAIIYQTQSGSSISADNAPIFFSTLGLPPALTFSSRPGYAYATISGTLTTPGTYPATISVTNTAGTSSATINFTSNSNLSSGFGAAMARGFVNSPFSYRFYSGTNAFMLGRTYSATNLPPGLSISPTTGAITGAPTVAGTFAVRIAATHNSYEKVEATVTLRITAKPPLPLITSGSTLAGTLGQPFSSSLATASDSLVSYAMDAIPPGLSLDSSSGLLSGTPTAAGTYSITASATNSAGTRTVDLILQIAAAPPTPELTSSIGLQAFVGEDFGSTLTASTSPASYSVSGLPAGLTFDSATKRISGLPLLAGRFPLTITSSNLSGSSIAQVTLDVLDQRPPVISSDAEMSGTVGTPASYTLAASHTPTSFGASNLPPGLVLDAHTGGITGTPTVAGTYLVQVTAANAGGSNPATLTFRIAPQTPSWLQSAAAASGVVGAPFSLLLWASRTGSILTADGLPDGLSFDGTRITGTPATAGIYDVGIRAKIGNVETLSTITINITAEQPAPPAILGALTASGFVGTSFSYSASATNKPTHFTAENLPPGLSLDSTTGVISGYPRETGIFTVPITASNSQGQSSAFVTFSISAPAVPLVTIPANLYSSVGQGFNYSLSTIPSPFPPSYLFGDSYPQLPAYVSVEGLPPGLFFDPLSQKITGAALTPGDYSITLTDSTALGKISTPATLHVSAAPDASTDLEIPYGLNLNAYGAMGSPFHFSAYPSGFATTATVTDLPKGLSSENFQTTPDGASSLGVRLTGIPEESGTFPVRITFSNATHSASAIVTIIVPEHPEPPAPAGGIITTGTVGSNFDYYLSDGSASSLNNAATAFQFSGLPDGLTYDAANNEITGIPTKSGRYTVDYTFTNSGGSTPATLIISIVDPLPSSSPLSSSLTASATGYTEENLSLPLASSSVDDFTISGLPKGLHVIEKSDGSWSLEGTSLESGTFDLLLTATTSVGSTITPLTLNLRALNESAPPPAQDPTATPVSDTASAATLVPDVILNKPRRIQTTEDHLVIRGHVPDYPPGTRVAVLVDGKWKKVRLTANGSFKLRLSDIPEGRSKISVRVTNATGKKKTIHLQIVRSGTSA